MKLYDLIIIGGGPTGLNIGIAAAKAKLNYLILEKGTLVNSIYNFPTNMTFFSTSKRLEIGATPFISHTEKPTRREALEYYRRVMQSWNLKVHFYETVQAVVPFVDQTYQIETQKGTYQTRAVAIATGFYDCPNLLDVPGENLSKVKHYYDSVHPYVGQDVLVVGAKNSAAQVALELWQKGVRVTLAIRGDSVSDKVKYWIKPNLENRIKEGSIPTFFNTTVKSIQRQTVSLQTPTGERTLSNDFVLAMTGYHPNFDLLRRVGVTLSDDAQQQPMYHPETLETNLPNIYLAGVICAGMQTSKLFIENTRDHGDIIVQHLLQQKTHQPSARLKSAD
ncbi:MAG: YpdA family putative bacillithiol disulfide reductase [Bacteroidota bacterium]